MNSEIQKMATYAMEAFSAYFGVAPTTVVQAPGRVNLIGEHTDYNDGFVLPCAIDHGTVIACRRREDALVRVLGIDINLQCNHFSLNQPVAHQAEMPWANYVRGMLNELQTLGLVFTGVDMAITGNVPQGAGLSSSASLEVAVGQAIKSLFNLDSLDATQLALAAQRAENHFVGCQCGIMDQLVSANGMAGHALLIDCRTLVTKQVSMPKDVSILIVHSGVPRGLVNSEYNLRRQQCEAASSYFGVPALRDVSKEMIDGAIGLDDLTLRRARHVVTENQRTLAASQALAQGDLQQLGILMAASHRSMQIDFEITVPAIDQLVKVVQGVIESTGGHGGTRMTGGGFGGCVVSVLPNSVVARAREAIATQYRAPSGQPAVIYECVASAGAGALTV